MKVIEGRIIASRIQEFGSMRIQYGSISIETDDGSSMDVKVDAYTLHDAFATGDSVQVEVVELGRSGIWVARRITRLGIQSTADEPESVELSSSP